MTAQAISGISPAVKHATLLSQQLQAHPLRQAIIGIQTATQPWKSLMTEMTRQRQTSALSLATASMTHKTAIDRVARGSITKSWALTAGPEAVKGAFATPAATQLLSRQHASLASRMFGQEHISVASRLIRQRKDITPVMMRSSALVSATRSPAMAALAQRSAMVTSMSALSVGRQRPWALTPPVPKFAGIPEVDPFKKLMAGGVKDVMSLLGAGAMVSGVDELLDTVEPVAVSADVWADAEEACPQVAAAVDVISGSIAAGCRDLLSRTWVRRVLLAAVIAVNVAVGFLPEPVEGHAHDLLNGVAMAMALQSLLS